MRRYRMQHCTLRLTINQRLTRLLFDLQQIGVLIPQHP